MGGDFFVALGPAAIQRRPVFGLNCLGPADRRAQLAALPSRLHSVDETLSLPGGEVAQVRQTLAVLGLQSPRAWGLTSGVNERHVVMGVARWRSRLPQQRPGLSATELTRLTLERSHSARQAIDVLSDLIARFGLGAEASDENEPSDAVFLIADGAEAYTLEAAGGFWALVECQHVRAVSDAALIRQDWLRLAPGLAEHVLEHGWWPDNGTKLDFAGCLGHGQEVAAGALRRWGRATLLLAQHNGALDAGCLRKLLGAHHAACSAQAGVANDRCRRLAALAVQLTGEGAPIVWTAVETPSGQVFFPLVVGAELPAEWAEATLPVALRSSAEDCERIQAQFDQDAAEFAVDVAALHRDSEHATARRLAQVLMQKHVEQWQQECYGPKTRLHTPSRSAPKRLSAAEQEAVAYAFG
jgi:hypothetical protein